MHIFFTWIKLAGFLRCRTSSQLCSQTTWVESVPYFSFLQAVAPYSEDLFYHLLQNEVLLRQGIRGYMKRHYSSLCFCRKIKKSIEYRCTYNWQNTIAQAGVELIKNMKKGVFKALPRTSVLQPRNVLEKGAGEVLYSHWPTLISTAAIFLPLEHSLFCLGWI